MDWETSNYKWDAEDYRNFSSQQKKWGRELMAVLDLKGDESVLDLGCGDGLLSAELAALVPRGSVVGVDVSPEMIRLARETFPSDRYPNLSWEVMDARELAFEERFDLVFSNAVLHWIRDQRAVLHGVARSLKPGGLFIAEMAGKGNAAEVAMVMVSLMADEEWLPYFRGMSVPYIFWSPEDYRPLLEDAGLIPRRVELRPRDMIHVGREGLAGWIRSTWLPFTQRVPEVLRERFVSAIVDGYLRDHPPDGEGLVHVNAVRLQVEAVKPR